LSGAGKALVGVKNVTAGKNLCERKRKPAAKILPEPAGHDDAGSAKARVSV